MPDRRRPVPSPAAFAEYLRIVWLTPDLDGLFRGPAGDRRRFLDRLVLAVDADHGARVSALERALRSRNRLLEERPGDTHWLDAHRARGGRTRVAVAAARRETVERLDRLIAATRDDASPFPWASVGSRARSTISWRCWPAIEAEDRYRAILRRAAIGTARPAGR